MFNYPFPEKLKRLKDFVNTEKVEDGFDLAYVDGASIVLNEVENNWDGGLTENWIKGIKKAIEILEETQ